MANMSMNYKSLACVVCGGGGFTDDLNVVLLSPAQTAAHKTCMFDLICQNGYVMCRPNVPASTMLYKSSITGQSCQAEIVPEQRTATHPDSKTTEGTADYNMDTSDSELELRAQPDLPSVSLLSKYHNSDALFRLNNMHISLEYSLRSTNGNCSDICASTKEAVLGKDMSGDVLEILQCIAFFVRQIASSNPPQGSSDSSLLSSSDDAVLHNLDSALDQALSGSADLLFRFVYMLLTGRYHMPSHRSELRGRRDEENLMLTCLGIVDTIRRIGRQMSGQTSSTSPITAYINDLLDALNTPAAAWDALFRFGFVGNRKVLKRKRKSETLKAIESNQELGLQFPKYSLKVLKFDNIGFKTHQSGGYVQSTALMWNVYPFHILVDAGIYKLSWERAAQAAQQQIPVTAFMCPQDEDYQLLGYRSREMIRAVLELLKDIPSYEELRQDDRGDYVMDTELPIKRTTSGASTRFAASDLLEGHVHALHADIEVENAQLNVHHDAAPTDHYSANYITPDNVEWMDLNKTECVKKIATHSRVVTQTSTAHGPLPAGHREIGNPRYQLAEDGNIYDPAEQRPVQPVQAYARTFMTSDGSPSAAIFRLQDAGQFGDIYNFPGAFHTLLEGFRMHGKFFRDALMEMIITEWRATEGKREWYLQPGDPRQVQDESAELLIAHYVAICRATCVYHGREDVSVEEVEQYLLTRAKHHAAAMDALSSMRGLEILFMIQDSERIDGHQLFRQARRLLSLLVTVTHATNYARIITSDELQWHAASSAEQEIVKRFIFSQQTRSGATIWGDRLMEWIVRDIRQQEGKYWSVGKQQSVEHTVATLPNIVKMRVFGRHMSSDLHREDSLTAERAKNVAGNIPLGNVFCKAYKLIVKRKLWDTGPIVNGAGRDLPPHHCLSDRPVSADYLLWPHKGEQRQKEFAITYCQSGSSKYKQVERSEQDVNLSHIRAFHSHDVDRQKHLHRKQYETSAHVLEGKELVTAKDCIEELNAPEARAIKPDLPSITELRRKSKKDLASLLSTVRIMKSAQQGGIPPFIEEPYNGDTILGVLEQAVHHKLFMPALAGCTSTDAFRERIDTHRTAANGNNGQAVPIYLQDNSLSGIPLESLVDDL